LIVIAGLYQQSGYFILFTAGIGVLLVRDIVCCDLFVGIVIRGLCSLRLQEECRLTFFEVSFYVAWGGVLGSGNAIKLLVRRSAYFEELKPAFLLKPSAIHAS
jgi:hypothetical protein